MDQPEGRNSLIPPGDRAVLLVCVLLLAGLSLWAGYQYWIGQWNYRLLTPVLGFLLAMCVLLMHMYLKRQALVRAEPALVLPAGALVVSWNIGFNSARVIVDPAAETIRFENCFVPRRGIRLAAVPQHVCALTEIKAVYEMKGRGASLTLATDEGAALVGSGGPGYEELRELLFELVPRNPAGYATDDPRIYIVYVAGAFGGLSLGWWLTPEHSSNLILALCIVAGAVAGVVLSHLLVLAGDRFLRVNLARPISLFMYGVLWGAPATMLLNIYLMKQQDLTPGTIPLVMAVVLVGAGVGFAYNGMQKVE